MVLFCIGHHGAGISPDSVGYIAAARHMAAGAGATIWDGTPLVMQPPLYPMLLATVQWSTGADPLGSAHVVNAVLFGLIVYLSGELAARHLRASPVLVVLVQALVLFSKPLLSVSVMAWSEPLFIALSVCFLLAVESYLREPRVRFLMAAAMAAGFAAATRYAGVTIIATGVAVILFAVGREWRTRIAHVCLLLPIAAAPLGAWAIRNYALTGTLLGPRASSVYGLHQTCMLVAAVIVSWYVPIVEFCRLVHLSPQLALCCIAVPTLVAEHVGTGQGGSGASMSPLLVFIGVYVLFLAVTSATTAYDPPNSRLVSPVYVPLTVLLLRAAGEFERHIRNLRPARPMRTRLLAVGAAIWLLYPVVASGSRLLALWREGPEGYTSKPWTQSRTIQWLRSHPLEPECRVYSNAPYALYIQTKMPASESPAKGMYNSREAMGESHAFSGPWPEEEKAYLVWFRRGRARHLFTVEQLRQRVRLHEVAELDDGTVYAVSR